MQTFTKSRQQTQKILAKWFKTFTQLRRRHHKKETPKKRMDEVLENIATEEEGNAEDKRKEVSGAEGSGSEESGLEESGSEDDDGEESSR